MEKVEEPLVACRLIGYTDAERLAEGRLEEPVITPTAALTPKGIYSLLEPVRCNSDQID
jgi:hypothetical protein